MARKKPRFKIMYGRVTILAILLVSFIILGAGIGFVVGAIRNMPKYDIENITGDLSSFLIDKDNVAVASLKTDKNRVALDQTEIPLIMKQALVAIEDQRFYKHYGFDPIRFMGAVVANIKKGYGSEGGSTLTQQLVKIAILENSEKKLRRKIQEAIIAIKVELRYTKEQILTMYLNNVYYGHGAHSLQTAAQVYFGKDANDLNLEEAAMLAGVINAPGRYSPYLNAEKAVQRQALVLNEMVKMNYITQETAEKAKATKLNLAGLKPLNYKYQSFADHIIDEAASLLKLESQDIAILYTAGYKIYTTMDSKAQEAAEAVFADNSNFPVGKNDKLVQSAITILDPHTGEIRVLVGGRDQQGERQFNRAVNAVRQPGSAIKPIAVYGPALEKGYSPATVLDDYPTDYATPLGPKTFVNYDNRYRGLVSMRTAIQYSINTAAVKMLEKIGVSEGFNFAKNLGISTLVESGTANDMGLSLGLGGLTKGVSPLELTAAYGSFANQGVYVVPHAIRKIEDKNGKVLYEHKTVKTEVMSPQTAYLMSDMLQTVVQAGTATRAKLDRPVAGKTGTTSFNVDAWFVGYTPDLAGSVWMGYDKTEAMSNVFGGNYCAPIWQKVMKVAHENIPISSFPEPEGIASILVDYKSGLLPSNLTPAEFIVTEKFNSTYLPTDTSNVWVQMPVCISTGQLLTNFCPTPVTHTFLKRPIPWTGEIVPEDAHLEPPNEYCTQHGFGSPFAGTGFSLQGSPVLDNNNRVKAVKISWRYNLAEPAYAFYVYRSTQPNVAQNRENLTAELSGNAIAWQDSNIKEGTRYYYIITVQNSQTGGQRQTSNEISFYTGGNGSNGSTTLPQLKTPHLTGIARINGSNATATLSWTAASESSTTVYEIYRSEAVNFTPSPNNLVVMDALVTGTTWADTSLSKGKTYYYKVAAYDTKTKQKSTYSNQLQVIIP